MRTSAPNAARDALETQAKSRIVAATGLLLALLACGEGAAIYRAHPQSGLASLTLSPFLLGAALLAHRTRRFRAPGALIAGTTFVAVALGTAFDERLSRVFLPTTLLFPTLLPQITTYVLGARSGVAMGAATIAYLTLVFAWLLLHPEGAGDPLLTPKYIVADGAIVIGLSLSILYTRARGRMVAGLRTAQAALDAVHAAEQRRMREDIDLAARIQTALLPRDLRVEGLEIAAAMLPAAEVGGDYYDVLPVEGGAWLCIGDVAGHGVNAGLTMLMMQSAVSALAQDDPAQSPGETLSELNTTLYQNIRLRMQRDEHATLTLLRYHRDGTVCFAGAHEEILVYRAAEGRCEAVATPGPWVGARPSIAAQVTVHQLTLAEGDVLVLYTDGLTEARDGDRRQFGLERVEAEILRARGRPVEAIREAILEALHAFSPVLADDVALLVARYHAPASA